jgi:hypothetical protein
VFDEQDQELERVIRHVRLPVRMDPALDRRVMERIGLERPPRRRSLGGAWHWFARPRQVSVSPLAAIAAAAALLAVLALPRIGGGGRGTGDSAQRAEPPIGFHFVLVMPQAASVTLVGDFNDWDPDQTLMRPVGRGVWTAALPLAPGRHRYAFLVDGSRWMADPAAPAAFDDTFDTPSSVVTVGGS